MTTETRQRIRAYKRMLPDLRERVIAVALLLAMSASMLGSASFAWMTLSRAPEISNVSTTLAANGNLEIALVTGNGSKHPDESKIGDSSATEGQSIAASNITWGNMINLSDPSYGLDHLVLRPATLNAAELLTSPLWGAAYSVDGRVEQMNSSFGYTSWQDDPDVGPRFKVTEDYGVRAISSMVADGSAAEVQLANMRNTVKSKNANAATTYQNIADTSKYMQSLATMMGLFMTARMNPDDADLSNPEVSIEDIGNLADMYEAFLNAMNLEADAIAALVNYAQYVINNGNNYVPVTTDQVLGINGATALTQSGLLNNFKTVVTNLSQFQKDYATIASDWAKLNNIRSSGTSLKWEDSGINGIVNNLVNVATCTIGSDNTPIGQISVSNATSYITGTQEARITNGILYRFEERTGGYLEVKELSISATVQRYGLTIPATVKANIQTSASREYNLFTNDLNATANNVGVTAAEDMIAQDTYGLAIDFWVRTNAANSYLKLEGNVLSSSEMVPAKGTDINGKEVLLFTVTKKGTDEEGNETTITQDVYEGPNGWLSAATHGEVTLEDGVEPTQKMVEDITILGYEGVNRVWDDELLSTDITTQGSGSCYVYYADTPEDQERSLKLLEAFNVVFISDDGKKLATAKMDVASHYAENGRVVVPLKLDPSNSIELDYDLEGNLQRAITKLEQNKPMRITAIVFLDGTKLTNKDVLSAADIQGQLNIQFGSSSSMEPIENKELVSKYLTVSASVDKTSFDWENPQDNMTSRVTVAVDGTEPGTVTAFFLRAINPTQGSREETMNFTKNADGKWVADYTFQSPGNYVLRTVRLDGVDYDLQEAVSVTVKGFAINNVSIDGSLNRHVNVLSAENSSSVDVRVAFGTTDVNRMPKKVQGRFTNKEDGSTVNIDFTYNATSQEWKGTAKFLTSGEYVLKHLILDGAYTELDEDLWHTASVTLGMRVQIYTSSPHDFMYLPSEWDEDSNKANLNMQVKILNNADKEMLGFTGVTLTYSMRGSSIKKMDTDLEWDGKYYSGSLANGGPGVWEFNNVMVGDNVLTNALEAPTFIIWSPEPPKYVGHATTAYQYAPNKDANMNVQITNSAAASVAAYIKKTGATTGTWVTGTVGSDFELDGKSGNNWFFKVPEDANGYQDGNWELTAVKVWDVFAEDGSAYTEDAPLEWDLTNTNNITKAVNRIYVEFPEGQSKDLGKATDGTITGTFLQEQKIPDMQVVIRDFEGQAIPKVSDVKLTFTYSSGSQNNGGYTRDKGLDNSTAGAAVTIGLQTTDGGKTFVFEETEDKKLVYAGNYATTFSFNVDDVPKTYSAKDGNLPANTPMLTVWSITPSVAVTATTPNGTVDNAYVSHKTSGFGGKNCTITYATYNAGKNTAGTVANVCYKARLNTTNLGITTTSTCKLTQPTVTITMSGYGNASGASLSFLDTAKNAGKVYASEGGTSISQYSWTADGTCVRYIGIYESVVIGNESRTTAGTITATAIQLTDSNNNTYTVDLGDNDIVINNPY